MVLGIPLTIAAMYELDNFYISLFLVAMLFLVTGSNNGPSVTMLQNTTKGPKNEAELITAYFFTQRIMQTISPPIYSFFALKLGAFEHPEVYGQLLAATVIITFGASIPFYYLAGKSYNKEMGEKVR